MISQRLMNSMAPYWDEIYSEGFVYGKEPSDAIKKAINFFKSNKYLKNVNYFLDLGCGCGRDTVYAAKEMKINCYGVDISSKGLKLGDSLLEDEDAIRRRVQFIEENALEYLAQFPLNDGNPLIIYSHYFLQVLSANDRDYILEKVFSLLPQGSLLIAGEYSMNDSRFGQGEEIEPHSYILNPEKPMHTIHFFSQDELARMQNKYGCEMLHLEEYIEHELVRESHINSKTWLAIYRKQVR